MKFSFKNIFILLFLSGAGFIYSQASGIKDIIAPLKLLAGRTDTLIISDLFYSNDYNLKFQNSKNIKIDYNPNKKQLIVSPSASFESFTNLYFEKNNLVYAVPVFVKKIDALKFSFKPEKKYKSIFLFGSFNNWNRQQYEMVSSNNNGIYEVSVPLEPGKYEYKFYADGEELLDPANKNTIPNGIGGVNSFVIVPDKHNAKIFLHKKDFKSGTLKSKFSFLLEGAKSFKINNANLFVFLDNKKLSGKYISVQNNSISVAIPNDELEKSKILRIIFSANGLNSNMQMIPLAGGKPAINISSDWYDSIIYSLMIDRFYDGDKKNDSPVKNDSVLPKANYMGGDFAGVTNKIETGYFDKLAINTIWISPVYDNPDSAFKESPAPHRWYTGYHGYWPISSNQVEEKFGTFEDLKTLVAAAHKHKIKVLLDFVSHHVHQDHPYFKQHRDWFGKLELPDGRLNLRLWDEFRLTTWFEPYLPSFDFVNSNEAANAVSDEAIWWLEQTGADGFRHDAVKHVPNKFWRALTEKLNKEIEVPTGKTVYQIGETFGNYDLISSYVNNGQLSAQFNFELYNTAQSVFIDPKRSFKDLDNELKKTIDVFGPLNLMGNIMDSHDKNRFMAYADSAIDLSQWNAIEEGWNNPPEVKNPYSYKKAELYLAYMLTIPGLPVIYYGSEFGMTGLSDPDNRRMMRFDDQLNTNENNMLAEVSKIIKARSGHSALRYGDYLPLRADDKFFAYIRSDFNERILVFLNKSDEKEEVELILPEFYSTTKALNILENSEIKISNGKIKLELNPRGYLFLRLIK